MDLEESSFNSLSLSVWSSSIKCSTRHSVWLGQYDTIICIWNILTSSSFSNGRVSTNGPPEERNGEQSRPMLIIIKFVIPSDHQCQKRAIGNVLWVWTEDEIIVIYELRSRYPINNNVTPLFILMRHFLLSRLKPSPRKVLHLLHIHISISFLDLFKETNKHPLGRAHFLHPLIFHLRQIRPDDGQQQATQHSAKNGHLLISIP